MFLFVLLYSFFFFFFQAEDGIRDTSVTGVQTCALPILESFAFLVGEIVALVVRDKVDDRAVRQRSGFVEHEPALFHTGSQPIHTNTVRFRSEERRVGKECRCGWRQYDRKEERRETTKGV